MRLRLVERLAALEAAGPDFEMLDDALQNLKRDGTLPENDALRNLVIRMGRAMYLMTVRIRPEGWQPTEAEAAADQICDCLARCVKDPAARVELRQLMAVRTLHGHLRVEGPATGSEPGRKSDEP